MAYSTSNPPIPLTEGPLAGFNTTESSSTGGKIWLYKSTDPIATVQGAGYISNGMDLGMQVGDIVMVLDTNLLRLYLEFVVSTTLIGSAVSGHGSATLNSTTTVMAD